MYSNLLLEYFDTLEFIKTSHLKKLTIAKTKTVVDD